METKYEVRGLSCASCLVKLIDGVRSVPGVDAVAVNLERKGTSSLTVHSRAPLAAGTVPEVVRNAGFWLGADEWPDEREVS